MEGRLRMAYSEDNPPLMGGAALNLYPPRKKTNFDSEVNRIIAEVGSSVRYLRLDPTDRWLFIAALVGRFERLRDAAIVDPQKRS